MAMIHGLIDSLKRIIFKCIIEFLTYIVVMIEFRSCQEMGLAVLHRDNQVFVGDVMQKDFNVLRSIIDPANGSYSRWSTQNDLLPANPRG